MMEVWRGRGRDLVLKRVYLGGEADLLLDVALIHEFGGNHMADVSRNGELRHTDPAMAMGWPHYWRPHQAPRGDRPHTVRCYREAYAARDPQRVLAAAPDRLLVRAVRG